MPNSLRKHLCFRNWQCHVAFYGGLRAREKQQCLLPQVHSQTLFQLTKLWILDVIVPWEGLLCSKAPHLKYKLSLSLADQSFLCETNQQMERCLATSSKRYAPLDLHLVWPISQTVQNSPWIYLRHFRKCCTFVITKRKLEARIPVFC